MFSGLLAGINNLFPSKSVEIVPPPLSVSPANQPNHADHRIVTKEREYRLQRIDISRSDSLDQIKFHYDDNTIWYAGADAGKQDIHVAIMSKGEYLIRVTHERYENYSSAGAGVEFETNKGRVFSYEPRGMFTGIAAEKTTFHATSDHEIISLTIRRGVLLGVVQQPVPAEDTKVSANNPWYTVVTAVGIKEDRSVVDPNEYEHFETLVKAKERWQSAKSWAQNKEGRVALFVDTRASKEVHSSGNTLDVDRCRRAAIKAGILAPLPECQVSVMQTVIALLKVVSGREDVMVFSSVTALLLLSAWLELWCSVVTAKVLAMLAPINVSSTMDDLWPIAMGCDALGGCNLDADGGMQKTLLGAFVIFRIAERVTYVLNVYIHHNAADRKTMHLENLAFRKVMSQDQRYYDTTTVSEMRGSMNGHALSNIISWNVPYIVQKCIKMVMTTYFMACYDVQMALIAVIGTVTMKWGILDQVSKREKRLHKIRKKLTRRCEEVKGSAFGMMSTVKMFSTEQQQIEDLGATDSRRLRNLHEMVVLRVIREAGYGIMRTLCFATVLFIGYERVVAADLDASTLTAFFLIYQSFAELFHSFKWHLDVLTREMPDIERYLSLMRTEPSLKDGRKRLEKEDVRGEIKFVNVEFEYPTKPGETVLKNLNLTIQPQKVTAIVGDSGAGKSTISKLLLRLYDPVKGAVLLDGVDLREYAVQSLHKQCAIVNQTPDLFNASLRDNITFGKRDASDEQVIAAAKLANCHDFISKFRAGYDSYAGGRGTSLSGGERQRVSIARAVICDPRILILDEATSALDAVNERIVQGALDNVMKGRTTVIIAHRLSTVVNADEIVCMSKGEVVERGTHDELMARRGAYYKLVEEIIP